MGEERERCNGLGKQKVEWDDVVYPMCMCVKDFTRALGLFGQEEQLTIKGMGGLIKRSGQTNA